ncbi:MAG TPA: ATP-dependent zinc metalloprotease FtsH [Acidimicrobiia bacterium]|nr:ATP-dependent zinc metalloprotease FtsH [Acidimicrobiia bacterium]
MSPPEDQWRPPEQPGRPPRTGGGGTPGRPSSRPRWMPWVIIGLIVAVFLFWQAAPSSTPQRAKVDYGTFLQDVREKKVASIKYDASSGKIVGQFAPGVTVDGKSEFTAQGPEGGLPDEDIKLLNQYNVQRNYKPRSTDWLATVLVWVVPFALLGLIWWFIARRAQGQMGAVMNIGRSRAKVYNTDKPKTTFADVAGYGAVKEEITEVVDFLKLPSKFKEIGARIPKGVLLVGPPGTGKTLIARAVAGEAGVPFISITGSDFMEMFVGVGAARVRDLFQTAKKQAPAIIFVDEIDSIGRKRGAGLGGGHDEREQTLNQMLAEMDGFEATEGIVMMAATNRPDILDPALLRPGRFDRQILVPLPTQDERVEILKVHMRDKKIDPDVDVNVVARGTPGMSGADLANLVNEAALFAVRRGAHEVHREDFDAARDRVLMGLKRESLALSEEEKEIVAYHEGGHAVCAYVLEHADPLHKVTILPTGMALGVTHQLPVEERHIYKREYIADSLVVRLGGRVAEHLVFGHQSTGAQNDLVGNTELARKMVREWGMSDRIGPMAWGSQGAVFLGEDLMHSRDYSDETARVIDEEVERILRDEEDRCRKVLTEYRAGLDAVAQALRERETLEGKEVEDLVDRAMGRKVGGPRIITHADGTEEVADRPLPVPTPGGDAGADVLTPLDPD